MQVITCGVEKIPSNVNMVVPGMYEAYWFRNEMTTPQSISAAASFRPEVTGITRNANIGSNPNALAVSTVLNTENWEAFVNDDFAVQAICSPTLEMWCLSWDSKYPNKSVFCDKTNQYGNQISSTISNTWGISCQVSANRNTGPIIFTPFRDL